MTIVHLIISLLLYTHITHITCQPSTTDSLSSESISSDDNSLSNSTSSESISSDSDSSSIDSSDNSNSNSTSISSSSSESSDSTDNTSDDNINGTETPDDGTDGSESDIETDDSSEVGMENNNAESIEGEGGVAGGKHALDTDTLNNNSNGKTLGWILGVVFTIVAILIIGILTGFLYFTKYNGFKTNIKKLNTIEMEIESTNCDTNIKTKGKYDTNKFDTNILMNDESIDDLITIDVDERDDGIDKKNQKIIRW